MHFKSLLWTSQRLKQEPAKKILQIDKWISRWIELLLWMSEFDGGVDGKASSRWK